MILILGAGPAGVATAFELHRSGKSFVAVEKNSSVGGLARTLSYGEFRTDIGPHRFFSKNEYLYDMIEDLLGEKWIKVNRFTRFYIDGKFFTYPIELKNALSNVGLYKAFRIISDYALERLKKMFSKKAPSSFEEQIVSDFGRALAELNMLNYTEKVWGLKCSEISPDWAKQRIRGLSLKEVVKKSLFKSKKGPKTLVDQFYYPDEGSGLIYEAMKERATTSGRFILRAFPTKIKHDNEKIKEVVVKHANKKLRFKPRQVVSSIPITELVNLLEPSPPKKVLEAAKRLKFRSHVSLFITIKKPHVFQDQWIYFPNKEIPFGRVMEPKNFSRKMSPPDRTSLLLEFFCWEDDKVWRANKRELFEMSIKWLEKLGFVERNEVINYFVHREKYAYPVYDLNYRKNVEVVKGYLKRFKNLFLIGRSGSFRYNNQDHALEMGILAARSIIEGRRYNIEEVGAEQEYFEKGYVK